MAQKKPHPTPNTTKATAPGGGLFDRQNLLLMVVGAVVIVIGMLLMVGGKSSDPAVFNKDEVYSGLRIKVAPTLIILGLVIEVVAIFRKPK